jgi:hypothetical protein
MKLYTLRIPSTLIVTCCLFASLLSAVGCRKEKALTASDQDENYFVVKDNPNDPVDHAIYEFYNSTGIASFCNDTIHRERISDSAGLPRYSYIKLSLSYSLFSNQYISFKPVSNKGRIPPLLNLLEEELLPRLPNDLLVPSFFLVDSIWTNLSEQVIDLADGWTAWHGFNTVAISVKDVDAMNADERRMFAASLLAGIAEKRLRKTANEILNRDFFSISRVASKAFTPLDIYSGTPFFIHGIDPPAITALGFVRYFINGYAVMLGLPNPVGPPGEADDLRAFLTAAFYYTPEQFAGIYPGSEIMLKKLNTIREIARKAGFRIPG